MYTLGHYSPLFNFIISSFLLHGLDERKSATALAIGPIGHVETLTDQLLLASLAEETCLVPVAACEYIRTVRKRRKNCAYMYTFAKKKHAGAHFAFLRTCEVILAAEMKANMIPPSLAHTRI